MRIRQFEHLEGCGLRIPVDRVLIRPLHHPDRHGLVLCDPELLLPRLVRIELVGPGTLEVDRVCYHEPGHGIDRTGRQEVADLLFGLLRDPAVDRLPRRFGVVDEVKVHRVCPVPVFGHVDVLREERILLLRPEGVCRAEGVVLIFTVQAGIDPGKPLPAEGVVLREVQHRSDLVGGRAAGALVGDREGRGDAVGREEEVFARICRGAREVPVEVERKPAVPYRDAAGVARRPLPGGWSGIRRRRTRHIGASRNDTAERDEACQEQQADNLSVHDARYGVPDNYTWR